jgi:hypothetical protein
MYGSDPLYKWARARQDEWWAEAERRRMLHRSKKAKRERADDLKRAEIIPLPTPAKAACDQTPGAA